jgi:hypothetical protein
MGGSSDSGGSSNAFVKIFRIVTTKISGGSSQSADSNHEITHPLLMTPNDFSDSDDERVYSSTYSRRSSHDGNNFGIDHQSPLPPIFLVTEKHPFKVNVFQTRPSGLAIK